MRYFDILSLIKRNTFWVFYGPGKLEENMKNRRNLFFKSSVLNLALLLSVNAWANAENTVINGDINNNNNVVNNQPIDVDGYLKEEAPVTDQELEEINNELNKQKTAIEVNRKKRTGYRDLQKTTKTLTNSTEKYLKERRNAKKNIDAYNQKLECLMETENPEECSAEYDKVRSKKAAVARVETKAPRSSMEKIKILPYLGSTAYITSNENDQLITRFKTGAQVEADFGTRFSGGIGFSYAQLDMRDFGSNNFFNQFTNPVMLQNAYYGYFNRGRDVRYRNFSIDATGKYTLYRGERVRPYVGAGASVNFARISYQDSVNVNGGLLGGYNFGNEELTANFISLGLNAGTEFFFSNSIGMNIDLGYSKGIGGQFNNRNAMNASLFPDQQRLQQLGDEIASAHAFSLTLGMLIAF